MCAHACREPTRIQRSIWDSFFFLPLDALEKTVSLRKMWQWAATVILYVCVRVYVCVGALVNTMCVSAAPYDVSQHILIQIHHGDLLHIIYHSLRWLWVWTAEGVVRCWLPSIKDHAWKQGKSRGEGWHPRNMIGWNWSSYFPEFLSALGSVSNCHILCKVAVRQGWLHVKANIIVKSLSPSIMACFANLT